MDGFRFQIMDVQMYERPAAPCYFSLNLARSSCEKGRYHPKTNLDRQERPSMAVHLYLGHLLPYLMVHLRL